MHGKNITKMTINVKGVLQSGIAIKDSYFEYRGDRGRRATSEASVGYMARP